LVNAFSPILFLSLTLLGIPKSLAQAQTPAVSSFPEGGTLEKITVASPSMGREIEVGVLLPPDYTKGTGKYPVLFALHGRDASYLSFMDMVPLRVFLAKHPMILVTFHADKDSAYIDASHRPKSLFTTFFFKELIPHVSAKYRTDGRLALTGFSMGGYGAMHYLLEKPAAFSSVSTVSSAFELFEDTPETAKWRPWAEGLLGPVSTNPKGYENVVIFPRIEKSLAAGTKLPPLLMLCGTGDFLLTSNRRFVDRLEAAHQGLLKQKIPDLDAIKDAKERRAKMDAVKKELFVDFEYRESPGAHDWPYWRDHFADAARFHWKHFGNPID